MPSLDISAIRRSRYSDVIAFLLYAILAGTLIWYSEKVRIDYERARISHLVGERAIAIQSGIEQALSSTYALATMIQLSKGNTKEFESAATALLTFYPNISALQLAPGGVIQRIVPLAGNEKAMGHNLLTDPQRDKEAFRARDTRKLTLAGPFQLVQGGLGAAGRLPVFLSDEKGDSHFWGFVVVLLRFPDALAPARLSELVEKGYHYEIWRMHPDTGKKQIITSSSKLPLNDPVEHTLTVPNATWHLSIAPAKSWIDFTALAIKAALALFLAMLMAIFWRKSGKT